MRRLLLFAIILSNLEAIAGDVAVLRDQFPEDHMDKIQTDMVEKRLKEAEKKPSSTAIGGSRSGQLDFEKRQDMEDVQNEHDLEKQRQLYEYEDQYRRGL